MPDEKQNRVLPDAFYAPVSVERARIAAERYRKLQFNQTGERPIARIPADSDDDDLVLARFIDQAAAALREREPEPRICGAKLFKDGRVYAYCVRDPHTTGKHKGANEEWEPATQPTAQPSTPHSAMCSEFCSPDVCDCHCHKPEQEQRSRRKSGKESK